MKSLKTLSIYNRTLLWNCFQQDNAIKWFFHNLLLYTYFYSHRDFVSILQIMQYKSWNAVRYVHLFWSTIQIFMRFRFYGFPPYIPSIILISGINTLCMHSSAHCLAFLTGNHNNPKDFKFKIQICSSPLKSVMNFGVAWMELNFYDH